MAKVCAGGLDEVAYLPSEEQKIVDDFHKLTYQIHGRTKWLGFQALKTPLDLFVYQEIIFEKQPEVIVELGTAESGSAVFMGSICDMVGTGEVITVDLWQGRQRAIHPRLTYLLGDSMSGTLRSRIKELVNGRTCMVVQDDAHDRAGVLARLDWYGDLVTKGQYLIVEDTNLNGHPVCPQHGPGPFEAVHEFLAGRGKDVFEIDRAREKYMLSFNPYGFLLKTK